MGDVDSPLLIALENGVIAKQNISTMSTMWISSPKPYRLIRTPDVLNFKLEEKKDGCFGYPISYVLDTLEGYVRKSKLIYDKVTEVTGNPVDLPEASQKVVMSKLSYIRL